MTNCWAYLNKLIHWRKFPRILQTTTYMGANQFKIIKVRWERPPYPFIKINTDGSYTNKRAGIGGIFRDHKGKTLLFHKAPYIADDALETEATALFWALNFAKKNNWQWILAEVDCSLLVELLNSKMSSSWNINQWIHRINKLSTESKIHFSFVFREANRPAIYLAIEGAHADHPEVSTTLSPSLQLLTQGDKLQIPYLRVQR
ncbi:uncharacterized protein LOC110038998 [Phalaenopsis equestris]|uniref:uncharacterized protein LOC110038998 n=1 Tax=Phalaenopsis equestris TaxID=78828 RepID=UPI0009E60BBB|nr:uncharacterized protein LOC110038998 [Phalaenopsis equestris]